MKTTIEIIANTVRKNPKKIAFQYFFEDFQNYKSISYESFYEKMKSVANLIKKRTQKKSISTAYILDSDINTQIILWGAQLLGPVVPINPGLSVSQIVNIILECNAAVVFIHKKYEDKAQEITSKTGKHCIFIGDNFVDTLVIPDSDDMYPRISENEIACFFHTGGTTGSPKIVPLKHKNCIANSEMMKKALSASEEDVFLCGLPLFHVNAIHITSLVPFLTGSTIVIPKNGFKNRPFFKNFWSVVSKFRVSLFSSVPTILSDLLSVSIPEDVDLSSLRYAITGAAPLSVQLFKDFECATGIKLLEGYGLTESTCAVCCNPIDGERKIGSVGYPSWGCKVRVLKLDPVSNAVLEECKPEEQGQIFIKGPNVFEGYLRDKDNIQVWENGWFNTGDLGYLDKDGYLWISGRSKDLIIRGGHNIDPKIVEEVLCQDPSVKMVACVAKKNLRLGEVPIAFITLNKGFSFDKRKLFSVLSDADVEREALPVDIVCMEDFPLTPIGKIFKPELRRLASLEESLCPEP